MELSDGVIGSVDGEVAAINDGSRVRTGRRKSRMFLNLIFSFEYPRMFLNLTGCS